MAMEFRWESLSAHFQSPEDETHCERRLQVRFDPLLGTSARIAEGVILQTKAESAVVELGIYPDPGIVAAQELASQERELQNGREPHHAESEPM